MVRRTRESWRTVASTGNRQGISPARMVGLDLCSERRQAGTDAGRVHSWRGNAPAGRAGSGVHGRAPLPLIFAIAAFLAFTTSAAAGQKLPPAVAPTADEIAAARGVEALLVDHMIQEMRKSVHEEDGLIPTSNAERIYRSMLDGEYARIISDAGVLGISDLVLEQIQGRR